MAIRRIHANIEHTPEHLAELRATREAFQAAKPTMEELLATGDYDGPFRHGDVVGAGGTPGHEPMTIVVPDVAGMTDGQKRALIEDLRKILGIREGDE